MKAKRKKDKTKDSPRKDKGRRIEKDEETDEENTVKKQQELEKS